MFDPVTAERNLQWGRGGGGEQGWEPEAWSIHRGPSRMASANFENWNFGNAISCDLVINFAGFGNPMV